MEVRATEIPCTFIWRKEAMAEMGYITRSADESMHMEKLAALSRIPVKTELLASSSMVKNYTFTCKRINCPTTFSRQKNPIHLDKILRLEHTLIKHREHSPSHSQSCPLPPLLQINRIQGTFNFYGRLAAHPEMESTFLTYRLPPS